jgi:hypothetical protein
MSHKKIISGIILIILLTVIFPVTKKTNAQTSVGYGGNFTSSQSGGSLTGIIGNLSGLITKLPGCTSTLGTGDLFSGIKRLIRGKNTKVDKYTSTEGLTDLATTATASLLTVPTSDPITQQMLGDIKVKLNTQGETLNSVDKSTSSDNKNNTCLNSIGKAVIKMIVDKMTVSIVNWINTGNGGESFFVKNPSKYFKDLAKDQLLAFQQELNDPQRFPFSKMYFTNVATTFDRTFQQNASYSLNQVQGGWNTFTAATNPANNPFGFALMASNEIQARVASEAAQKTEELAQSGGFLGDERCADPVGVTKEEDAKARRGEHINYQSGTSTSGIEYQSTYTQTVDYRRCNQWEYVTPGKTIAEELTSAMNDRKDALLDADTLNDAIAAILDAAIAKLSSTLTNKGLAAISMDDISSSYDTSNYDDGGLASIQQNQSDRDFSDYQRDSSPWLQGHPDFNIRTDVTQALIDEQRIYAEKLGELNYVLMHNDSSTVSGKNGLIPTIYQLDYCIPGPNPEWQENAEKVLDQMTNTLWKHASELKDDITDNAGFQILDLFTLGFANTIVSTVNNYAFECGSELGKKVHAMVAAAINTITGVDQYFAFTASHGNLCSPDGLQTVGEKAITQYAKLINKHYGPRGIYPSVAAEAKEKYEKVKGYNQMIIDNEGAIAFQNGIVKRLQAIKAEVDKLNTQYNNGQSSMTEQQYEDSLIVWKNAFARISSSLVSGGDIAHVDSLVKQAEDERVYILDELIQGKVGCEAELKMWVPNPNSTGSGDASIHLLAPTSHDWGYARPSYPKELPILYTYSTKNQYDYNKGLDGMQPPTTIVQPYTGNPSTGSDYQRSFLGSVPFATTDVLSSLDDGVDEDPYGNLGGDILQGIIWWGDVINLNAGLDKTTSIFNSTNPDSPVSGNAAFLEKALGIY